MAKSKFILQFAQGTSCPDCRGTVTLLCKKNDPFMDPSFYICFPCNKVAQVGRGPVERES
jgi:hypothetical protein